MNEFIKIYSILMCKGKKTKTKILLIRLKKVNGGGDDDDWKQNK